jgi:predicted lipoprotein with Yx(FWY)xxD motif
MRGLSRKPLAVLAGFVLLGLGLSAAFMLSSSGAQGTATYTYPKPPPKTTTSSGGGGGGGGGGETTTEPETSTDETTTELATTAAEPSTSTTTTTTTTTAAPAATLVRVRIRSLARLHATVLVDQTGKTLYRFTHEKARHVACTGGCAAAWPPLLVGAGLKPLAGLGVSRLHLGTIRRPDGKLQVTYWGFPLYRFSGDAKPGDAKGQGYGKAWFAIRPSGRLVGH